MATVNSVIGPIYTKDLGFTLCALNLDRAFDECLSLYSGGDGR